MVSWRIDIVNKSNIRIGHLKQLTSYNINTHIVKKLKEHNIDCKALYMIGFPGETRAQIQKTVDLALNLGIEDFNLSIVTALPGTPLYDECLEN